MRYVQIMDHDTYGLYSVLSYRRLHLRRVLKTAVSLRLAVEVRRLWFVTGDKYVRVVAFWMHSFRYARLKQFRSGK